jgi:uncharacterized protein
VVDVETARKAVRLVDGGLRLVVQAKPRARAEGLERGGDGQLVVRVRAPPVEGAANERIVAVLAELLGLRKSELRIVRGESSRHKELSVTGLTLDELVARLTGS